MALLYVVAWHNIILFLGVIISFVNRLAKLQSCTKPWIWCLNKTKRPNRVPWSIYFYIFPALFSITKWLYINVHIVISLHHSILVDGTHTREIYSKTPKEHNTTYFDFVFIQSATLSWEYTHIFVSIAHKRVSTNANKLSLLHTHTPAPTHIWPCMSCFKNYSRSIVRLTQIRSSGFTFIYKII